MSQGGKGVARVVRKRPGRLRGSISNVLTPREIELRNLILSGIYRDKQLAATMKISVETVTRHKTNIYDKLGVRSVVELILRYCHLKTMHEIRLDDIRTEIQELSAKLLAIEKEIKS